jgi:hypothetical protein
MTVGMPSASARQNLLELYTAKHVNRKRGLADVISAIDVRTLVNGYKDLRQAAPSRHTNNLSYLVAGHDGVPSTGAKTTRREEHLALALWNHQSAGFVLPDGSTLRLIDYQVPLKARRADSGVGKLDLFGLLDNTVCVVELKVAANSGNGDTPLRAFLEALAYCAIIEANKADISNEIAAKHGVRDIADKPLLIVIAPEDYWIAWRQTQTTGDWWPALRKLASELQSSLGLKSRFLALKGAEFRLGLNGTKPILLNECLVTDIDGLVTGNE